MTRAALIVIDDEVAAVTIHGLPWVEYQVRRAVAAGARHIVVLAAFVTPDIVRSSERARGAGIATQLARDGSEVADAFHPDEQVLVLRGHHVGARAELAALFAGDGATLLCTKTPSSADERIDADDHWVGIAVVPGNLVRTIAPTIGDWDLASTLAREAVRIGAVRCYAGSDESVATSARAVEDAARHGGWGERWIIAPFASALVRLAKDHLGKVELAVGYASIALYIAAPLTAMYLSAAAALVIFVQAEIAAGFVTRATALTAGRTMSPRWMFGLQSAAFVLLMLASLRFDPFAMLSGALLATVLILASTLARDRRSERWLADFAGSAVLLLIGALTTFGIATLLVTSVHAVASLAWLQNRLSKALRPIG